jgi:putative transposase
MDKSRSRNITFQIYPGKNKKLKLFYWLFLHRELYNAALYQRRDAYSRCGVSLSYNNQQNMLPDLKNHLEEYKPLGSHALQETLRKLDRAFQSFFRRIKRGEKPGFPRYKPESRFNSFCYPDPAGWKILSLEGRRGTLKIGNLGVVRMRGKARVDISKGEPRTLTIRYRNGKWYATIGVRYPIETLQRNCAYKNRPIGIDAGVSNIVATSEGDIIKSTKRLSSNLDKLQEAQG